MIRLNKAKVEARRMTVDGVLGIDKNLEEHTANAIVFPTQEAGSSPYDGIYT